MFAREALHAIRLGKIVQLVLIGGNVLAALLDLLLQTAYLPPATDLLDHALIADEQNEPAEQHQRNHVLVQHPAPDPRMLGYVLLYVLKNLHDAVIQNVSNSTRLNSLQRYKKNLTFANIFTKKYRLFHFYVVLTLSVACPIILTLSVASKLYLDNGSQEPPLRCLVLGIFDAGLRVSCARDFMSGGILPLLRL